MRAAVVIGFVLAAIVAIPVACISGGNGSTQCSGGCLCNSADSCPTGCYRSQINGEAPFCSNGIVDCVQGGSAWSVGTPMNNCGNGSPTFLTGGGAPSGAFCCAANANGDGSVVDASGAGDGAGE